MIKKIIFLLSLFCLSCSSDNIIRSEKTDFYNIYKDIIIRSSAPSIENKGGNNKVYNREWLSKFNQPITLLSSLDGKKSFGIEFDDSDTPSCFIGTWIDQDKLTMDDNNYAW